MAVVHLRVVKVHIGSLTYFFFTRILHENVPRVQTSIHNADNYIQMQDAQPNQWHRNINQRP